MPQEKGRKHEQQVNHAAVTSRRTPSIDAEGLIRAGLTLIPLHRWDAKDARGRPRGKTPRHGAWQARDYDSREVLELAAREGINDGVRLPSDWLVLDVDPRNFPEDRDSLTELVVDTALDLSIAPHTMTGSGGHHYWFRKPADAQVLDSLETYPGVEFKSRGRQVVAPGSIHPNGKPYRWDDFAPFPEEAPPLPNTLLSLIRRPTRAHPRNGIPQNSALAEQKLRGMEPEFAWWHSLLYTGELPGYDEDRDWSGGPVELDKSELYDSYLSFARNRTKHPRPLPGLAKVLLSKVGVTTHQIRSGTRKDRWVYVVPDLGQARAKFAEIVKARL